MHNILPPKGMSMDSRGLFNFWEISDSIWLPVHDKDAFAMED